MLVGPPSEISPHDKLPKPNISGGEVTTGPTGAGEAPFPVSDFTPTKRGEKTSQNQGTWKNIGEFVPFLLGELDGLFLGVVLS